MDNYKLVFVTIGATGNSIKELTLTVVHVDVKVCNLNDQIYCLLP